MGEKYYIKIGTITINDFDYENRCLSQNFGDNTGCVSSESIPWAEQGNPWDWKYEDGEFVYDAIEMPTQTQVPTEMEKLQAQILYTAILTDSLLEDEE